MDSSVKYNKKCDICGKELSVQGHLINAKYPDFVLGEVEINIEICDICKNNITELKSADKARMEASMDYFNPYIQGQLDKKISEYLIYIIKKSPIIINTSSYSNNAKTSSGWISGMRIIAWIMFFGIIIGGIMSGSSLMAFGNSGIGFVIIIGCFIVAFVSVGLTMVILDTAEDVKFIRNNMKNK